MNTLIIDGTNLVHRSYHAVRHGQHTPEDAAHAALATALQSVRRLERERGSDHTALAFDTGPSFRSRVYPDYKAGRAEKDPALGDALTLAAQTFSAAGLRLCCAPDYEADDVVATLCARALDRGHAVTVVTSDTDLYSLLAHPDVTVVDPGRRRTVTSAQAADVLGHPPERLPLYKALCGDPSDNIPGVRGVGHQTTLPLVTRYRDVETLWRSRLELRPAVLARLEDTGLDTMTLYEHLATLAIVPEIRRYVGRRTA